MLFFSLLLFSSNTYLNAQDIAINSQHALAIRVLIGEYTDARKNKDSILLNKILTKDIDQLVSSGTWRKGKNRSLEGMMNSSSNNPGERTITIDNIRMISSGSAIVDTRYEIKNADGSVRKMWSTFVVVDTGDEWKITAIRNMKPAE